MTHICLAWLLLLLLLAVFWSYGLQPTIEQISQHSASLNALKKTQQDVHDQRQHSRSKQQSVRHQLQVWLRDGRVATPRPSSEAHRQLAAGLKKSLQSVQGRLLNLSPLADRESNGWVHHSLRATAELPRANLGRLLDSLSSIHPTVYLDWIQFNPSGDNLEWQVQMSSAYFPKTLWNQLKLDPDQQASAVPKADSPGSPWVNALFNKTLRTRLADPHPNQYRLVAISSRGSEKTAILTDPIDDQTLKIKLGEDLDGWQLTQVSSTSATFRKQQQEATLTISNP